MIRPLVTMSWFAYSFRKEKLYPYLARVSVRAYMQVED
jgi:hypothetical protein